MSAEIQRNSPLTDLKEGRNELDWRWLFFFYFEIFWRLWCGGWNLKGYFVKNPKHSRFKDSVFCFFLLKGAVWSIFTFRVTHQIIMYVSLRPDKCVFFI